MERKRSILTEVMSILGPVQSLLRLSEDPTSLFATPQTVLRLPHFPSPLHGRSVPSRPGEIPLRNCAQLFRPDEGGIRGWSTALRSTCRGCTQVCLHILVRSPRAGQDDVNTLISALSRFLENDVEVWLEVPDVQNAMSAAVSARDKTVSWLREVRFGLL